jgi:hypothetical protein
MSDILSRHLGKAKEQLRSSLPPSPSRQYFPHEGRLSSYSPLEIEPSDHEKNVQELNNYERIPGFSIPSRQQGVPYPVWSEWQEPTWTPSYQREQFLEMTDPSSVFPVT